MLYKNREWFVTQANKGYTNANLAKLCKVDPGTIKYWAKKHGITLKKGSVRQYYFNESFFDVIDTEEKAYILGLIAADGYIDIEEKSVSLQLHSKDEYILNKIKSLIGDTAPLYKRKNKNSKTLTLSSKKLVKSLNLFGIVRNKTLSLSLPNLDTKFMKHFLRGYFDGDGWIGKSQAVLVGASYLFLSQLKNFIFQTFNYEIPLKYIKRKNSEYWRLEFCTQHSSFFKWMYQDNLLSLPRKYKSYLTYWAYRKE